MKGLIALNELAWFMNGFLKNGGEFTQIEIENAEKYTQKIIEQSL